MGIRFRLLHVRPEAGTFFFGMNIPAALAKLITASHRLFPAIANHLDQNQVFPLFRIWISPGFSANFQVFFHDLKVTPKFDQIKS